MTEPGRGALPLLLLVALGTAAVAAVVLWTGTTGPSLRVGSPAPDFRLRGPDGQSVSLGELRGRVVFVNFWATWCPPCRDEAPSMQKLYENLRGEPFELLAISIDAPDELASVREFGAEFGWGFPVLLDPEKSAYDSYQAFGVPESFLIDGQGRLAERFIGPKDWADPRYAKAIRRLIARSEAAPEASGTGTEAKGG